MSCNGCRVLRKGCAPNCVLRPCLDWISSPEAQGHATLFVSKFFGRSDLISFISAVPIHKRPALFQSLLFEACGRTINPVNGAVGLLSSGNWHACQAAVDIVLAGGTLHPLPAVFPPLAFDESSDAFRSTCASTVRNQYRKRSDVSPPSVPNVCSGLFVRYPTTETNACSDVTDVSMCFQTSVEEPKLLNLFE